MYLTIIKVLYLWSVHGLGMYMYHFRVDIDAFCTEADVHV